MSRRENVLVTPDWAEQNLNTDGVVFVEVDEDTTAYDAGHIPGAVRINWKTELQDPVVRDFVDKGAFEKLPNWPMSRIDSGACWAIPTMASVPFSS